MPDTQQFIDEYFEWSSQEKFKDFGFIPKLTDKKKLKLSNNSKFNFWAFVFGPLYYFYLGLVRAIPYTFLGVFLLCLGFPIGICAYIIFSFLLSTQANKNYVAFLRKKKEKYSLFDPDSDTPYFNISSARLIILSFLTGGFYFLYWGYRNWKAVKISQNLPIHPFAEAFFMALTSVNIFSSITHSAKLVNYTKKLRPVLSAWLFFFFFGGGGYNSRNKTEEEITVEVAFMIILIAVILGWLFITLLTLLVNKYQKAIRFYCEQKGLPSVKGFTFWEIVLIILGVLTNLWLILYTFLIIRAFL